MLTDEQLAAELKALAERGYVYAYNQPDAEQIADACPYLCMLTEDRGGRFRRIRVHATVIPNPRQQSKKDASR